MIMLFEQEEATRRHTNRLVTEARLKTYAELVDDGKLTTAEAAERMHMTVEEFKAAVQEYTASAEA